jgi:hypothetical protein
MITEIWKPVVGYEGLYEVSNLGRVKSLGNTLKCSRFKGIVTIMRQEVTKLGYCRVALRKDKKYKHWSVHRLVAITFLPNPDNLPVVNHKDENPSNNCVDNLEWCTHQYNLTYGTARKRGAETFKKSNVGKCHYYKGLATKNRLKVGSYEKPVHQIDPVTGDIIQTFRSISEAERTFNTKHVTSVVNGRRPRAKGYFWKLAE